MKFSHYLRILFFIGKYTDIFQGWETFVLGVSFYSENSPWAEKFSRGEFSKGNFTLKRFDGIPLQNSF